MRQHKILANIGITICTMGILFVIVNWFTGIINQTMTTGASAICLSSLVVTLSAIIGIRNPKRK